MIRHLPNAAFRDVAGDSLQVKLLPDEAVLWAGRPARGLVLTAQDWVTIPFSIVWCWLAFKGVAARSSLLSPTTLIFGAFAAYFLIGRFVMDAWIRRGTRYVVTNRRVLIERGSPFRKLIALDREKLVNIELFQGGRGRGTLRFGQVPFKWWYSRLGVTMPSLENTPQFIRIADAEAVFDLLQKPKDRRD